MLPGRTPGYNRKKEFNEVKFKRFKVTCSWCGTEGHNKKTYPKYPQVKYVCVPSKGYIQEVTWRTWPHKGHVQASLL